MSTKYVEKDGHQAITFEADKWEATVGANGERIYTATADGAGVTIDFKPSGAQTNGTTQTHEGLKTGSTVTIHSNKSVTVKEKR